MKKIIVILFMALFVIAMTFLSCKKKDDKPKYEVTYTFNNNAKSYYVQIWDVTELNNFSDSIHTSPFTKTITYDYDATYRCKMTNGNNNPSNKSIAITYNSITNTQSDNLYPSIESFITP